MRRLYHTFVAVAVLAFFAGAAPAWAQEQRPGIGVDARGGQVIDPTENVKALNAAEAKRQDDLRGMEARFQNAMRDAETRRISELATQKQIFDLELARIISKNAEEKSQLLATQVAAVKADLDARMSKQEQFRWESGGRSDQVAWIVALIASMAAIAGPIIAIFALRRRGQQS